MAKYFFQYDSRQEAEGIVKALSLMLLIPSGKIKGENVWESHIKASRKIETLSVKELLTFTVCRIKKVPSLTIIELEEALDSDKVLIDAFKDSYLGSLRGKVEKTKLLELAKLQSNLHYCEYLEDSINPRLSALKRDFEQSGLNEKEIKELEKLCKTNMKPVNDWIKSKCITYKKMINPLGKFIVRGY